MKPETKVKMAVWVAFIMGVLSVAACLFVDKTTGLQILHLVMSSVYFSVGYAIHFEKSRPWAIAGIVMSGLTVSSVMIAMPTPMLLLLAGVQLAASILGFQGVSALNANSGKAAVEQQVSQNSPPKTPETSEPESPSAPLAESTPPEATERSDEAIARVIFGIFCAMVGVLLLVMFFSISSTTKSEKPPAESGVPANAGPASVSPHTNSASTYPQVTPNQLIASCGEPLTDVTEPLPGAAQKGGGALLRDLSYRSTTGSTVGFRFVGSSDGNKWSLVYFSEGKNSAISTELVSNTKFREYAFALLPCLKKSSL